MFFLPSCFFLMRSLNFRPGGRGPSVPVLLREGGVGNLSHRIKGSSAEEVQARSHPRLLRWMGRTASSRDSCLRELPGDKYPSCRAEWGGGGSEIHQATSGHGHGFLAPH